MVISSKGCKPDNFNSYNSLKVSFKIFVAFIQMLMNVNLSLNQSLLTFRLCETETNFDESIDSGNFSVKGCLPSIQKDSITYMHSLAVYVKEGLPFASDVSLENSMDFCMFFTDFTTFSVLLLFPLSIAFFSFFYVWFFYSISSNIRAALFKIN